MALGDQCYSILLAICVHLWLDLSLDFKVNY
jgi:hypothetical protein